MSLGLPGGVPSGTMLDGPLYTLKSKSDGGIFVPGPSLTQVSGTWTVTRDGAGLYKLRRTGASAASVLLATLDRGWIAKIGPDPASLPRPGQIPRLHDFRGVQLTGIDVIFSIGTANLNTGHNIAAYQTPFLNGVTPAVPVTTQAVTNLPLTTVGNIQIANVPIAVPFVVGNTTTDTEDYVELTIDDTGGGTSVYDLWGLMFYYNYNLE